MQLYQQRTADYIEWFYNEANFPPSNDNADDVRNSIFDVSTTVEIESQIIPPVRNAIWIGTKDMKTRDRIRGVDNVGESLIDNDSSSSRQHLKEEEGISNQHKPVHHHQQHYLPVNVLPGQNRRFHNTDAHHYHTIHERRELEHDENDDPSSSKVDGSRMRTRNLQAATNTTAPTTYMPTYLPTISPMAVVGTPGEEDTAAPVSSSTTASPAVSDSTFSPAPFPASDGSTTTAPVKVDTDAPVLGTSSPLLATTPPPVISTSPTTSPAITPDETESPVSMSPTTISLGTPSPLFAVTPPPVISTSPTTSPAIPTVDTKMPNTYSPTLFPTTTIVTFTPTVTTNGVDECPANEPYVELSLVITISYKLINDEVADTITLDEILSIPFSKKIYREIYRINYLKRTNEGVIIDRFEDLSCTTELELLNTEVPTLLPSLSPIIGTMSPTPFPTSIEETDSPTEAPITGTFSPTETPTIGMSLIVYVIFFTFMFLFVFT